MKPYIQYSILAAALACGMAQGVTSYTTPVGYISLGDTTPSEPACAAGSEVTGSIPLLNPAVSVLTVDSYSSGDITVTGTLTPGDFDAPVSGAPYIVQVTSGTREGVYALIQSNTASVLTVLPQRTGDLDGLSNGDTITIRLASTASALFPPASLPAGLQINIFDRVDGINTSSTVTLQTAGPNWINITASALGNDFVFYPGESFVIVNPTGTDVTSLVVSGEVPVTDSRVALGTYVSGAQDTRFSFVSPVSQEIQNAGIPAVSGDQVLVFDNAELGINKSSAITLQLAGPNWINITASVLANDFPIDGGKGYVFRRAAAGDGSDLEAVAAPSYVP